MLIGQVRPSAYGRLRVPVAPWAPRWLLVIPFLWCLVGASAATQLGIRADLALPVAAAALLAYALVPSGQLTAAVA